jgi:hypothetical protein
MKARFLLSALAIFFATFRAFASSYSTIPFELIDNRIFFEALVNGKGPYHFILDTGGSYSIDTRVAEALKLPMTDPFPIAGVGSGTTLAYHTRLGSILVGEQVVSNVSAMAFPTIAIQQTMGFKHFDGIFGHEFLEEHVVKVDFMARILTIWPSTHDDTEGGAVVPLTFEDEQPIISARVDGLAGKFLVDTGDRFSLTLFAPFAKKNNIRKNYPYFIHTCTGQGIGGSVWSDVSRLGVFDFGPFNLTHFPVRFPNEEDYSDDEWAGSIGNGLLKSHNFIVDFPRKRLVILDKTNLSYREYDRSGLWMTKSEDVFEVLDVVRNSPAWVVGIHPHDLVLAVNGKLTESLDLPDIRNLLANGSTDKVEMKIKSGTAVRDVTLILGDLI